MSKFGIILLALVHLYGPAPAYAPVQDSYRVEVLRARVRQTEAIRLWAIRNGVKMDADHNIWR